MAPARKLEELGAHGKRDLPDVGGVREIDARPMTPRRQEVTRPALLTPTLAPAPAREGT